jgi:glycosyltransferase involved in cell wall biosynthesis
MAGLALFDDFSDSVLGHHPDFIVGLANAAAATAEPSDQVRLYCPAAYLTHHRARADVVHRDVTGASPGSGAAKLRYSRVVDAANLAKSVQDAAAEEITMFFNCYFDENYPAWPAAEAGLRYVHSLHRPGYFAADAGRNLGSHRQLADLVRTQAPHALFVVNTRAGERQASRFIPSSRLLRTGWPTATRTEVAARFERRPTGRVEPYVLSLGSARGDKGIEVLMAALAGGPTLRVVGQQYEGVEARLTSMYPHTRVDWETGWVSRQRMHEVIDDAAVLVFPYQDEFATYGGASGALAQALTAGKPVIVSDVLSDQVPPSPACQIVPASDPEALRRAVDVALRDAHELHEAAAATREYVEANHTYEGHLRRILDRCPE